MLQSMTALLRTVRVDLAIKSNIRNCSESGSIPFWKVGKVIQNGPHFCYVSELFLQNI